MAYTESKYTNGLDAASSLTGSELVPIFQDGLTVQSTAQDIANLAVTPELAKKFYVEMTLSAGPSGTTVTHNLNLDNPRAFVTQVLNPADQTITVGFSNFTTNSVNMQVGGFDQACKIMIIG